MNDHAIANVAASAPPTPERTEGLRFSVGVDRKLTDNNYGAYAVSVHIAGVTTETTEAEIDELLGVNGKIAYTKMIADLGRKLDEVLRADEPYLWRKANQLSITDPMVAV